MGLVDVKLPLASVTAISVLPLAYTLTPGNPSPVLSVTRPFTGFFTGAPCDEEEPFTWLLLCEYAIIGTDKDNVDANNTENPFEANFIYIFCCYLGFKIAKLRFSKQVIV